MNSVARLSAFSAARRLCESILVLSLLTGANQLFAGDGVANESLRRAVEYLWSRQADDGGWHSEQYAVLRSGQALTPFVLHALLGTIDAMTADESRRVQRAVEFIHAHVDEPGALGHFDPDVAEYPVYSTAYAVLCLKHVQTYRHLRRSEHEELIVRMERFLARAMFDEGEGFAPTDVAYGGWGFDAARKRGEPGHMDLAHTRRALQALSAPHNAAQRPSRDGPPFDRITLNHRAQKFLRLVQKHPQALARQPFHDADDKGTSAAPYDGGFYFSPVVLDANKGRETTDDGGATYFRSYATATCDGVLALLAAGVSPGDERVERAVEWLRAHNDFDYPQGVPTDHPDPWGEAIRYYHYAVRAEAYDALRWPGAWRAELAAAVVKRQARNGSFRNTTCPLMKEDDPILGTALAVVTLAHCVD